MARPVDLPARDSPMSVCYLEPKPGSARLAGHLTCGPVSALALPSKGSEWPSPEVPQVFSPRGRRVILARCMGPDIAHH